MPDAPSGHTGPAPLVSVAIPMFNEAARIEACLASVLANTLPDGHTLEVLVFDGDSTDDSADRVRRIADRDPRVRLLRNPERLQADAFNRAIREARGTFLVRMDAHSLYAPDYVAECVRLLQTTGAANVGGVQRAVGDTPLTRAVAAAVSSPFAAGDAKYRYATEPAWVDTVYLGAWRVKTLRDLDGMRPGWAVNEDYEMNVRLRQRGGRVYLSPTIRSEYHVRGSIPKLARQYFRYGFWKVRTLMHHPGSLRWRQLVAPAFILSLLATPLLVWWLGALGLAHVAAYLGANLAASVAVARRAGWSRLPLLPIVFATIHLSWGSGFWCGLGYWPWRRDQ